MTGVGPPHPDILTPAEWDILGYLRRGMSNRQIANTRNSSVAAVKYHITNIRLKLTRNLSLMSKRKNMSQV